MLLSTLRRLISDTAAPVMLWRAVIVGINFAVMLGLAAGLGLAVFGPLMVNWGMAMVGAAIIGCGGPLILLQGGDTRMRAVAIYVLGYPLAIGLFGLAILPLILPGIAWMTVLALAFAINLVFCGASLLRVIGSVQWSMALRDAAPSVALGFAAMLQPDAILSVTALILSACGAVAVLIFLRRVHRRSTLGKRPSTPRLPWSMWGASVLGMALAQVDIIVGGAVLSDTQIGLYAFLRRIANLVALPVSVATWVTATPIARAYTAGDRTALIRSSRQASRIALIPGIVLLITASATFPILGLWQTVDPLTYIALLACSGAQLIFAATFTVATMCDHAHFAAMSRLVSLLVYLGLIAAIPSLGPSLNALAYLCAVMFGATGLWAVIRRELHIDTAATALLARREGMAWTQS
ncbi:hypothetical protein [Yoonia sp. 2307UL14-13]|uniref:hypothetical protein n=1 Tax=Yoonia sp. 2307UL14-13 TaxID=3126506 RepID=UPI00309DCCB1